MKIENCKKTNTHTHSLQAGIIQKEKLTMAMRVFLIVCLFAAIQYSKQVDV